VDQTLARDRVRHSITNGESTYIWYNSQRTVYAAEAGEITADMEQAIPTYEDVLELPVEEIAAANYQTLSDMNCIYVETAADAYGYVLRYWVSVDTGLLVAAEKQLDGETVYRMWETSSELDPIIETEFTLPDGTDLLAG